MKITGSRILWEGRFLRMRLKTYITADGTHHDWECYERTSHGVVIIVPVRQDGCVLLIRQFRPPVGGPVLELPAGLVDAGETPMATAHRELVEETGYAAQQLDLLIKGPYSPALTDGTLDVFMATNLSFVGKSGGDRNEEIETIPVPLDAVTSYVQAQATEGQMVDLKIIGFIELAMRRLGIKYDAD